ERIAALQKRLADIEAQRDNAKPAGPKTLDAQRDEVEAALARAKDVQATVQNLAQFATRGSGSAQGGGLAAQIAQWERSVPEARHSSSTRPTTSTPAPPPTPTATPTAGAATTNEAAIAPFH